MILSGNEIKKQIMAGSIIIEPFCQELITTNSYDLILGNEIIVYTDNVLDVRKSNSYKKIPLLEDGYLLEKGAFVLGSSEQIIGSNSFVPIIHTKSSIARLGLFAHITADLIDIGFVGNCTFQLFATLPVKIYAGMKIAQVTFRVPKGEINLYDGKYMNSIGPQASKIYLG